MKTTIHPLPHRGPTSRLGMQLHEPPGPVGLAVRLSTRDAQPSREDSHP